MEQNEKEIDISAVATQALQDRQSGEDWDEALLRACKRLYGYRGIAVFQAVQNGVAAVARETKADMETALRQVAEGKASLHVRTIYKSWSLKGSPQEPSDALSPGTRFEVAKALAGEKPGNVTITTKFVMTKPRSSALSGSTQQAIQNYHCPSCGYESEIGFSVCPQCRKAKKRSLWFRLFG